MAIALQTPRPTSQTAAAVCWGRISVIGAALAFDALLVWSVARLMA